jgi:hypothetical protein
MRQNQIKNPTGDRPVGFLPPRVLALVLVLPGLVIIILNRLLGFPDFRLGTVQQIFVRFEFRSLVANCGRAFAGSIRQRRGGAQRLLSRFDLLDRLRLPSFVKSFHRSLHTARRYRDIGLGLDVPIAILLDN